MIIRIVKLSLKAENIEDFKQIFHESRELINAFDGCESLELMEDLQNNCIFFTISSWKNEECLELYRDSYLFKNTWFKVKPLFSEKAQAWSLSKNFKTDNFVNI
jgi:quinol monooxygenase YgiN